MRGATDASVMGYVKFTVNEDATLHMEVNLHGISTNPDTNHGIHIHTFGDLSISNNASSAGGHWNPTAANHGCPPGARHYGDTGNWLAEGGNITGSKDLDLLALTGGNSIIGRAVVLHATEDDCNDTLSAMARLAFCVIGVGQNTSNNASSGVVAGGVANAICVLQPIGSSGITGVVIFQQTSASDPVLVTAKVSGLVSGSKHGFHIHEFGDLSDNVAGNSAGAHYNPLGGTHYLPGYSTNAHLGDMGNIYHYDVDGTAYYQYENSYISLTGVNNILGRAVLVHNSEDLCNVTSAGSRLAYCVIGIRNTDYPVTFIDDIPNTQSYAACEALATTGATTGTTSATSVTGGPTTGTDSSAFALKRRYSDIIAAVIFTVLVFVSI